MNAILAAYDQARFGKSAASTAVPTAIPAPAPPNFRGMEMTDAMRSIRNAIEESIRKEKQLLGQAEEGAAWGRSEVGQSPTGTWVGPVTAGAALAGAGAAAGSAINKYAPSQSAVLKAVQAVRRGSGKDKGWDALLNQTVGAAPTGVYRDIDMAQAIMPQGKYIQKIPGRAIKPEVTARLQYGTTKPRKPKSPGAKIPKSRKVRKETPFWQALDNKDSGRKALRERIMTDELATKGQGLWKRSPALRGALKSLGVAAAFYVLPHLWRRLSSDVAPETEEAAKLIQAQLKLADRIAAWRKAQMTQLDAAKGRPEALSLVPWADYAAK